MTAVLALLVLIIGEATGATAGWWGAGAGASHSGHRYATAPDDALLGRLQAQVAGDGLEPALRRVRELAATDVTVLRDGHHYVHELGRSAQARYGTAAAFARCDSSFHGGCYHGVIQAHFEALTAVNRAGLASFCRGGVIPATSTALEWECDHGLGHGLETFFAHDLPRALEHCDALTDDKARELCYGGTFMQRVGSEPAPVDLCAGLDARYLTQCNYYFALAAFRASGKDVGAAFVACDRLVPRYAVSCYEAMGAVAGSVTSFDPLRSLELCRRGALPYQPYCVRGAAQFLVGMFGSADQATRMCEQAPAGMRSPCFEYVGLSTAAWYADPTRRAVECAKSPPEWMPVCRQAAGLTPDPEGSP